MKFIGRHVLTPYYAAWQIPVDHALLLHLVPLSAARDPLKQGLVSATNTLDFIFWLCLLVPPWAPPQDFCVKRRHWSIESSYA